MRRPPTRPRAGSGSSGSCSCCCAIRRVRHAGPDTTTHLAAAYGKWPGLFARLALTYHLIEIADAVARGTPPPALTVISEATAERTAAFMLETVLPHLLRAHAVMFASPDTNHCRWIAGHILAHKLECITVRDVMRAYRALSDTDARPQLVSAMANLVAVGWVEPVENSNRSKAVNAWTVNPEVHVAFATKAEREREAREAIRQQIAENAAVIRKKR